MISNSGYLLFIASTYLLASVPSAYLVGKLVKNIDLRYVGSGTIGASNVYHNVGKYWVIPVGLFDGLVKSYLPITIAQVLGLGVTQQILIGLTSIIGHNWPIFLRFKGGRGVAPSLGVLLSLGQLELAFFTAVACAGWQLYRSAPIWVLISFITLPLVSMYLEKPLQIIILMYGILFCTITKRLLSNFSFTHEGNLKTLLMYRIFFDRDISDSQNWVKK